VYLNETLEEVMEGPDEGELLVVRRALSGLATQEGNEQRESIFHTRCTIGDKLCSLIIDGGSCTNVASKMMVDKLKLAVSPHPSSYTIQWLNYDKGIQVSSHCLLSLSIGKTYKDEIWCDVIPMDACHVLLGRPWLFDRHVTHDGQLNTYSFVLDHKRITLTPLRPSELLKTRETPQKDLLLSSLLKAECHEFKHFKEWLVLGFEETKTQSSHSSPPYFTPPSLLPCLSPRDTSRPSPSKNHPTQN